MDFDKFSRENRIGPQAFAGVKLLNQHIWNSDPERANEDMLDAISTGGFGEMCIQNGTGNYEGEIMAIRAGWVDGHISGWTGRANIWRLNEAGANALRAAGRPVPVPLPARDDWHSRPDGEVTFEYCAYEVERAGKPMLRLFKEAFECGANGGMHPLLRREDVVALRDYLDDWLGRH